MNEAPVGEVQQQAPQIQPAAAVPPQQEKLVPQHTVNELISDAMQRGKDKGYQQARTELGSIPQQQAAQAPQAGLTQADVERMTSDAVMKHQQKLQETLMQQQQEAEAKRVIESVGSKMDEARSRIPDYNEKVAALQLDKIPQVLWYASKADNSADVLYDLANHPEKVATLLNSPAHLADQLISKLSSSIKTNQQAENQPSPPDPSTRLTPSNTGSAKGAKTAAELRVAMRGKAYQ